jgi:site-specific DNA recombinase
MGDRSEFSGVAHKRPAARVRCAIYTRKSTEEGLDQDFNSLQAQREAAEAYIKSKKHLGWHFIPNHYDDGGFSRGSLERPALQKLLDDIDGRRIDCVVVYKVDRLSRSLLDFARLIERFEHSGVTFVSVTQQFNTTNSLGLLTLNILLSFAQFEREIISERTRDKMSAARKKGKWVGGTPVLGYDVDPRGGRLLVNQEEAKRVKAIFELFRSTLSLPSVVHELKRCGWVNKSWNSQRGVQHLGRPFTKASLRRLLNNAVYAGKVEYRGSIYPGEHEAVVDELVWKEVNANLRSEHHKQTKVRERQHALLSGLLFCQNCNQPMIATYTAKQGRRYRYYVCRTARANGWASCPTKSVSAEIIETSLLAQLNEVLKKESMRKELCIPADGWQETLEANPAALIRATVEAVRYDGASGRIQLDLSPLKM